MKKIVKSLFAVILVLLCVIFVACGEQKPDDGEKDEPKYEYNTQYTDNLKLTSDYAGKSFINEGIGIVTLSQAVQTLSPV